MNTPLVEMSSVCLILETVGLYVTNAAGHVLFSSTAPSPRGQTDGHGRVRSSKERKSSRNPQRDRRSDVWGWGQSCAGAGAVGREASEPDAWEESKRSRDSLSRGKEVENGDNGEL